MYESNVDRLFDTLQNVSSLVTESTIGLCNAYKTAESSTQAVESNLNNLMITIKNALTNSSGTNGSSLAKIIENMNKKTKDEIQKSKDILKRLSGDTMKRSNLYTQLKQQLFELKKMKQEYVTLNNYYKITDNALKSFKNIQGKKMRREHNIKDRIAPKRNIEYFSIINAAILDGNNSELINNWKAFKYQFYYILDNMKTSATNNEPWNAIVETLIDNNSDKTLIDLPNTGLNPNLVRSDNELGVKLTEFFDIFFKQLNNLNKDQIKKIPMPLYEDNTKNFLKGLKKLSINNLAAGEGGAYRPHYIYSDKAIGIMDCATGDFSIKPNEGDLLGGKEDDERSVEKYGDRKKIKTLEVDRNQELVVRDIQTEISQLNSYLQQFINPESNNKVLKLNENLTSISTILTYNSYVIGKIESTKSIFTYEEIKTYYEMCLGIEQKFPINNIMEIPKKILMECLNELDSHISSSPVVDLKSFIKITDYPPLTSAVMDINRKSETISQTRLNALTRLIKINFITPAGTPNAYDNVYSINEDSGTKKLSIKVEDSALQYFLDSRNSKDIKTLESKRNEFRFLNSLITNINENFFNDWEPRLANEQFFSYIVKLFKDGKTTELFNSIPGMIDLKSVYENSSNNIEIQTNNSLLKDIYKLMVIKAGKKCGLYFTSDTENTQKFNYEIPDGKPDNEYKEFLQCFLNYSQAILNVFYISIFPEYEHMRCYEASSEHGVYRLGNFLYKNKSLANHMLVWKMARDPMKYLVNDYASKIFIPGGKAFPLEVFKLYHEIKELETKIDSLKNSVKYEIESKNKILKNTDSVKTFLNYELITPLLNTDREMEIKVSGPSGSGKSFFIFGNNDSEGLVGVLNLDNQRIIHVYNVYSRAFGTKELLEYAFLNPYIEKIILDSTKTTYQCTKVDGYKLDDTSGTSPVNGFNKTNIDNINTLKKTMNYIKSTPANQESSRSITIYFITDTNGKKVKGIIDTPGVEDPFIRIETIPNKEIYRKIKLLCLNPIAFFTENFSHKILYETPGTIRAKYNDVSKIMGFSTFNFIDEIPQVVNGDNMPPDIYHGGPAGFTEDNYYKDLLATTDNITYDSSVLYFLFNYVTEAFIIDTAIVNLRKLVDEIVIDLGQDFMKYLKTPISDGFKNKIIGDINYNLDCERIDKTITFSKFFRIDFIKSIYANLNNNRTKVKFKNPRTIEEFKLETYYDLLTCPLLGNWAHKDPSYRMFTKSTNVGVVNNTLVINKVITKKVMKFNDKFKIRLNNGQSLVQLYPNMAGFLLSCLCYQYALDDEVDKNIDLTNHVVKLAMLLEKQFNFPDFIPTVHEILEGLFINEFNYIKENDVIDDKFKTPRLNMYSEALWLNRDTFLVDVFDEIYNDGIMTYSPIQLVRISTSRIKISNYSDKIYHMCPVFNLFREDLIELGYDNLQFINGKKDLLYGNTNRMFFKNNIVSFDLFIVNPSFLVANSIANNGSQEMCARRTYYYLDKMNK